jgi:type VI secretion system secreted protein VgrG
VSNAKKAAGLVGGCQECDVCTLLKDKERKWLALAIARSQLNVRCFRGGDETHQDQTANAWKNVSKCQAILTEKNCSP